tara:strand:- start:24609 stop:25634 length:1026 start_codon:yes stop_codon:yes gene_type:complete
MATWKKVLTEDDGNLGTTNLTITDSVREVTLASSGILRYKGSGGNTIQEFADINGASSAASFGALILYQDSASNQATLRLHSGGSGSSAVNIQAPSTGSQTIILPSSVATAGQVLEATSVNSSTVTTGWADAGSGGVTIDNYAENRLLTAGDSSSNIDAEFGLTFDGFTLDVVGHIEYTADANTRTGELYDASANGRYETGANITSGDMHFWKKTGSVVAFKIYTLNGSTQLPELLDASSSSTNIDQIAGLCPISSNSGAQGNRFYVRCMATIPTASVNGTYSNSAGDPIYLDASNAGELTLTEPTAGYVRQMGYVLSQVSISSTSYYVIWFDPSPNYIRV